ncbi:porin family protein [Acinetobacter sp. ME22]|uniref:outer membrane protein n=1 Tax=Acinetobacter sp. ME22 TaxID=2904802 RepID=UPI001EDB3CA9|nr:outer membrane protein [Acinetobacter sp. ME22]MCG2573811.1 porin family protein [Acinetobacter sp. ME22]
MKKLTLSAVALSCLAASVSSHAVTLAESAYVSAKLGASSVANYDNKSSFSYTNTSTSTTDVSSAVKLSDDKKTVFSGNVAYGVNFEPAYHVPVRAEVEYSYHGKANLNSSASPYLTYTPTGLGLYTIQDKHELTLQTFMLNGYYDFKNSSRFTPYVSAGVGLAHTKLTTLTQITSNVSVEDNKITENKSRIAWAVGAGFSYEFTPKLSLDLTYRYLNAGSQTSSNYYDVSIVDSTNTYVRTDHLEKKNKVKVSAHDVTLGLRYAF